MHDLLNTAPCGFVAFADDGTMIEANTALTEMLAFTRFELLGWHIDKILPPGGRIFYQTYLFPMLKVHGLVEEIYMALRTKDGRDVPVLLNARRRERDGRFVSDCVCLRMIQRHEYEDQLLHARRLAEESSAAKAKFLSMMSHDLRTPLTTIMGNAHLLADGEYGALDAAQREAVQIIRDACAVQLTMMNDILEFARLDSGHVQLQPSSVPVADAISRAESLVRVQVRDAGLTLITRECDVGAAVMADPNRLQQILLNLLTNAVKFTPAGGQIDVSCDCTEDRVRINVRDSGIGIAADQLQRIFSPFVQLETVSADGTSFRGVGLGLAISRDLARAMDGDVTAQSTPGQGSVFTIDLPAAAVATLREE
jgi:PAS domain S-box-containing protein